MAAPSFAACTTTTSRSPTRPSTDGRVAAAPGGTARRKAPGTSTTHPSQTSRHPTSMLGRMSGATAALPNLPNSGTATQSTSKPARAKAGLAVAKGSKSATLDPPPRSKAATNAHPPSLSAQRLSPHQPSTTALALSLPGRNSSIAR